MDVREVHNAMDTSMNMISMVFNGYLLYLIKNHSTFGVTFYQVLLAVDAGLDFALALTMLFAQPVALTAEGYFIVTSNGFFGQQSLAVDSVILTVAIFVLHTNVLWIPIQFAYRYAFLCLSGERRDRIIRKIAVLAVLWSFVVLLVIGAMFRPSQEFQSRALRVLELNHWPTENTTVAFGAHLSSVKLIVWEVVWFISSIGGAAVVFRCEVLIVAYFRNLGDFQLERTRRMHQEFHRALLAMAICPIITTAIPIAYFIVTIGLSMCPGPVSAFLTTAVSSITAFNPLTTIAFTGCYRRVVLQKFCGPCGLTKTERSDCVTAVTGLELTSRATSTVIPLPKQIAFPMSTREDQHRDENYL